MKPEGRSLQLMVVGLGQAGGNLASEFFRRGYPALAINTAQTDLSSLDPGGVYPSLPADRRIYIGLDGYDGAGMDPSYSAECLEKSADVIRESVLDEARDADVLYIAAGLGGGTGSSVATLVSILKEYELPMVGLFTLPTASESGIVKVNAVKAINEVVDAALSGWIFVDNGRIAEFNQDVSVVDYYAHINGRIASPIDGLNRINDREDLRAIRSFDGEDLRKMMLAGGVLSYDVCEIEAISADQVMSAVRRLNENSELMPAGSEIESTTYAAIVIEANESDLAQVSISTFEAIDEQIKEDTHGAALYRGVYRSSNANQKPLVRILLSSQSLPDRIRELLTDAQREGTILRDKLQEPLPTLELGDIATLSFVPQTPRARPSERPKKPGGMPSTRHTKPVEDMQREIVPPRRPAAATPAKKATSRARARRGVSATRQDRTKKAPPPSEEQMTQFSPDPPVKAKPTNPIKKALEEEHAFAVPPSALLDDKANPEAETKEVDMVEELSRSKRPSEDPFALDVYVDDDLPTAEAYDALVSEYLEAENNQLRSDIARRLEIDAMSEHTMVRYYAVEAMTRLDPESFGNALRSASEDPDEAVRAIAREALRI